MNKFIQMIIKPWVKYAINVFLFRKDYTMIEPYSVLGGAPAKVIATNVRRIYNMREQRRLMEYFQNTSEKEVIVDVEDMNEYCLSNFFY